MPVSRPPATSGPCQSGTTQSGDSSELAARLPCKGKSVRNRGVSQTMPFLVIPRSLLRGGFIETGLEVKKRTGGAQQPWVSSSPIAGQFYFAGAPAQRPPTAPAETPQGSAPSVTSPQPPSPPPNVANAEERGKAVAQDKQEVAQP